MDISFSCVCPVIDNEFRNNIVKVVCGPIHSAIASWIQIYLTATICYDEIHDQ